MSPNNLLADEELTDLCINQWKVLQKKQGFRFSIDSILLAHFITPGKTQHILDMGTGSGVIPLLIASRHPQVTIDGIELQPDIAEMAQRSVLYNNQQDRITIRQQDLTQLPKDYARKYDWVVSNPPFFPIGSGKFSPNSQMALARHEVGCTLDDVVKSASYCVSDRGHFAMIHRAERLPEILSTCQKYKLAPYRLRMVQPTAAQPANLLLLECIYQGRNRLTVLPPLVIYEPDHSYTAEVLTYYE